MRSQAASFPVHDGPLFSLVDQGYRYIVNVAGAEALYRLSDTDERTNLPAEPAKLGILAGLRATLSRIRGIDAGRRRQQ